MSAYPGSGPAGPKHGLATLAERGKMEVQCRRRICEGTWKGLRSDLYAANGPIPRSTTD